MTTFSQKFDIFRPFVVYKTLYPELISVNYPFRKGYSGNPIKRNQTLGCGMNVAQTICRSKCIEPG